MITKEYIIERIQESQEALDALKETDSKAGAICADMITFHEGELNAYQDILWKLEH